MNGGVSPQGGERGLLSGLLAAHRVSEDSTGPLQFLAVQIKGEMDRRFHLYHLQKTVFGNEKSRLIRWSSVGQHR